MKRKSTGAKVDAVALRQDVRALVEEGSDGDEQEAQRLVERLMALTPTSTTDDDEHEWRDGYVYEPPEPTAKPSPHGVEAPTAAVSSVGSIVIHKVAVEQEARPSISALSCSIASQLRRDNARYHRRTRSAPSAAEIPDLVSDDDRDDDDGDGGADDADDEAGSGSEESDDSDSDGGIAGFGRRTRATRGRRGRRHSSNSSVPIIWNMTQMLGTSTVGEVVRAIVRLSVAEANAGRPGLANDELRAYELRIMDDDEPDYDFPQLDASAKLLSTGEKEFALCLASEERMVMQLRVEDSVASTGTVVLKLMFRLHDGSAPAPDAAHEEEDMTTTPSTRRRRSVSLDAGLFDAASAFTPNKPPGDAAVVRSAARLRAHERALSRGGQGTPGQVSILSLSTSGGGAGAGAGAGSGATNSSSVLADAAAGPAPIVLDFDTLPMLNAYEDPNPLMAALASSQDGDSESGLPGSHGTAAGRRVAGKRAAGVAAGASSVAANDAGAVAGRASAGAATAPQAVDQVADEEGAAEATDTIGDPTAAAAATTTDTATAANAATETAAGKPKRRTSWLASLFNR